MTSDTDWMDLAPVDAVGEGEVRTFDAGSERVAVARAEGTLYAVQDRCSHDDAPLGEGCLVGHEVQCPRHGARFDVRSGAATAAPALVGIGTFEVREVDGRIQVAGIAPADDW